MRDDVEPPAAFTSALHGLLDGAAYVLQFPLALSAVLVTCVLLGAAQVREAVQRAVVFAVITAASGWWPPSGATRGLVPAALLALGLAAAGGLRPAGQFVWPAVVAGGSAAGWAGGMQTASWQEAVGGGLALGGVAMALLLGLSRLRATPASMAAVLTIGRRVVGAWIAAVGVLLLALSLRGGIP